MTRTNCIAKYLSNKGFSITSISQPNEMEDGNINITETVSVQVGIGYFFVTEIIADRFIFSPELHTLNELTNKLRQVLGETK